MDQSTFKYLGPTRDALPRDPGLHVTVDVRGEDPGAERGSFISNFAALTIVGSIGR
jgi:hypothetical protein